MFLAKFFIKNYKDINDPAVRNAYGKMSGYVGICVNLLLSLLKITIGFFSGSIAILADGFNNFTDLFASVITIIGFMASAKPADKEHPFGHARMEYISSMIVSFIIMLVGSELLINSVKAIIGLSGGQESEISHLAIIILVLSIVAKLLLGLFYRTIGKKINSTVIIASGTDSFSDSVSTLAVLISSILIKLTGIALIDSIAGILVSIPIIYAGFKMLNETKDILLGEGPVGETVCAIERIIEDYPDVIATHDLMVHNYGPGRSVASFHAEVDGKKDIYYLHDMIDNLERRISADLSIACTIHMDPIVTDDENVNEMKAFLKEAMADAGLELSIHDFRIVVGNTHTNMIFDVVLPFGHPMDEENVKLLISRAVSEKRSDCYCVITVDRA